MSTTSKTTIAPTMSLPVFPCNNPLATKYPSNHAWTIYGSYTKAILAQPKCITYPLFIHIAVLDTLRWGPIYQPYDAATDNRILFYGRIIHFLTTWSEGIPNFQEVYCGLPFHSSRIRIGDVYGLFNMEIPTLAWQPVTVVPSWEFENQTQTYITLQNLWGIRSDSPQSSEGTSHLNTRRMPPTLPVTSLVLKAWLHDTVNLVTVHNFKEIDPTTLYAFKTNKHLYQLYQEINSLLNLPPHENIIQIVSLVTKSTLYSLHNPRDPASTYLSKPTEPIIGFLTPYHSGGGLSETITSLSYTHTLTLKTQAKWARQLTSALLHVFLHENGADKTRCGVHTNLKMNNIVLTSPEHGSNVILLDFEKGNNWPDYDPPEVEDGYIRHKTYHVSTPNILRRQNSMYEYIGPAKWEYINTYWAQPHRSDSERESAMVWSLACCLWCIVRGYSCMGEHYRAPRSPTPYSVGMRWLWEDCDSGVPEVVRGVITRSFTDKREQRPRLKEFLDVLIEWEKCIEEIKVLKRKREEEETLRKKMKEKTVEEGTNEEVVGGEMKEVMREEELKGNTCMHAALLENMETVDIPVAVNDAC